VRNASACLMSLPTTDVEAPFRVAAFLQRLQELGWTDRRNMRIDYRLAESDTLQSVAAAQVALAPDILLVNGSSVLKAVRAATRTIPIVFVNVIDPVGQGFVMSLDHPGGNITGLSNIESRLGDKWLRLLKEIAPQVTEVAGHRGRPRRRSRDRGGDPGAGAIAPREVGSRQCARRRFRD